MWKLTHVDLAILSSLITLGYSYVKKSDLINSMWKTRADLGLTEKKLQRAINGLVKIGLINEASDTYSVASFSEQSVTEESTPVEIWLMKESKYIKSPLDSKWVFLTEKDQKDLIAALKAGNSSKYNVRKLSLGYPVSMPTPSSKPVPESEICERTIELASVRKEVPNKEA